MRAPLGPRLLSVARSAQQRWPQYVPAPLVQPVPRDHHEDPAAFSRRRRVVGVTAAAGAGLLGLSLAQEPDSARFYGLTFGTAATWLAGGAAAGPLHLGQMWSSHETLRRPVVTPVVSGVVAFSAFYGIALLSTRMPLLHRAIDSVLQFAEEGTGPAVYATTLANGLAEEVFFRGALYAAVRDGDQVALSTAAYALATCATRNPALVAAATVMGTLFGVQRRVTGGIQASILTHLTWSALMLRFLPPLFRRLAAEGATPTR